MKKFIMLIRGQGAWEKLSAAEMEATLKRYGDFTQRLRREGRLLDSEPLEPTGTVMTEEGGVVTDGPFAETKEMIGGYYAFHAKDLAEASEIARGCPALTYGDWVEVRPVMEMA